MTKFLTELITDDTEVINLRKNSKISDDEKYRVLDLDSSLSNEYIEKIYYKNKLWYYFKKDKSNYTFPFFILDELIGTYLAKARDLPTISYLIAKVGKQYGLASINFKSDKFKYYRLCELTREEPSENKLETLISLAIHSGNEEVFLNHLFNLFSLDIHMIQKDRGELNLQFQIDKETGYFDIASLYDYSNCSTEVGWEGISIPNKIIKLNYLTIRSLLKKYKVFKEALELCLDQSMKETFDKICEDFHFNQDCAAYEEVSKHYKAKDESQKQYINEMLKGIK